MRKGRDKKAKSWVREHTKPSDYSLERARLKRRPLPDEADEAEKEEVADSAEGGAASGSSIQKTSMEKKVDELSTSVKVLQSQLGQVLSKMDILITGNQEMGKDIKNLQGEITEIKSSLKKTEDRIQQLENFQKESKKQHQETDELKKKVIYLEDNSRRNNIKIMNFDHKKEMDLKMELVDWINCIMNPQQLVEEDIDRIHFLGGRRSQRRPIILKFASYAKKEQFLKVIKGKPELLVYKMDPIQIYQDLSRETTQWRRTMKPITSVLVRNSLRYNWGHPVFLKIWKDGSLHIIHSYDDGRNLMKAWGLWQEESDEAKQLDS